MPENSVLFRPKVVDHILENMGIDLSELPEGYGFCYEIKITDTTENKSKPILDRVTLHLAQ